jgi:hypothetical protein
MGALDDHHHVRVPRDLIVEANARIERVERGSPTRRDLA